MLCVTRGKKGLFMVKKNIFLKINSKDNVAIVLYPIKKGTKINIDDRELVVQEDIPKGYKIALTSADKGEEVIKYGYGIGIASQLIKRGTCVHIHNLKTGLKRKIEYRYKPDLKEIKSLNDMLYFRGYERDNGQVGIRNEIWVINTVGCVNKPAEKMVLSAKQKYRAEIEKDEIDGIFNFSHPFGCSQLGEDLINTQKILAGLVKHPNAVGVLVVGLGCENNLISEFKKVIGDYNDNRVKFINLQDVKDEIKEGLNKMDMLVKYAKKFKVKDIPVSKLKIGLKCGGSDSFSGITANPLVGKISDRIVSYGGTVILTEVPEMFGAENILMNRAQDKKIFHKIVDLINGFKDYFLSNGQVIYENPSPGNKESGITTLEEKSLGNIKKGGTTIIRDVLFYGDQVIGNGLQLLESPGNDLVSTTALTAAGAQIILFTTGRGNPLGSPVPTVKISTNSELYEKKNNWIDFNAGQLIEGVDMDKLVEDLMVYILKVVSGEKRTKNEVNNYRDIGIFKKGVTL